MKNRIDEIRKEIKEEVEKFNKLQLLFYESYMKDNGELKPIYSDDIMLFIDDLVGGCEDYNIEEIIYERLFMKLIEDNRIWIVSDLIEELEDLENEE